MIKIFLEINGSELEVSLKREQIDDITLWKSEDSSIDLTIEERYGKPIEDSILDSASITTPKAVIFDRFLQAFNQYSDDVISGFEPTENIDTAFGEPEPYNPDDIKVRREGFSVFEMNRMMTTQDDIDLNPAFQRKLVWDNARKSALIESILLGIPIPVFYFAESKSGRYHVVDGLQRLSTLKQFLNNEFPLKKLEHLGKECNGRYYIKGPQFPKLKDDDVLERKYSRRLENAQLFVNVIESSSPQKVKYDIFKRINTGGRPLNYQEIRNCVASDDVRNFLKEAASSEHFIFATGSSVSDARMEAQELVLRFVGFCLESEKKIVYSGDMNSFLNSTLDKINDYPKNELENFKRTLYKTLDINYHLFGKYAFRKCLPIHLEPTARKQAINKALFISWCMETISLNQQIIESRVQFGSFANILAKELVENKKYFQILTTGTSDTNNLKEARQFAKELINKHLNFS